jgi:bidirectional [NiFe] hydrogenase diaphorase subunit
LVDKALKRSRYEQHALIEVLHVAQDIFGYLDVDILMYVARALRLPPSKVYGVATFYSLFSFEAPGAHSCMVCTGTACFVKGADEVVRDIAAEFDVVEGGTSADGRLTLTTARCIGSCSLAPMVLLDEEVLGKLGSEEIRERIRDVLATTQEVA